jgi:adenylyltransferase and sulfurtransferase
VEINNLHRQLLHKESAIGLPKVDSARQSLLELNSGVRITTHCTQLDSSNARDILGGYDLILDCTDNVATRYLLNDACVLLNKPLVSGSALQLEGQLTVYNFNGGPCYRCMFPKPPPPEAVTNCGDGGVLGAITGVIGTLQALEAIKIVTQQPGVLAGRLLLFDGEQTSFRNVKLRAKRPDCDVCSTKPKIQQLIDYEQFCGAKATDKDPKLAVLDRSQRITVQDYQQLLNGQVKHVLVDVRSPNEFEICQLPANSINIPIKSILDNKAVDKVSELVADGNTQLIVVCRRGNDSQLAVARLKEQLGQLCEPKDIIGGLHAWTKHIDPDFPIY